MRVQLEQGIEYEKLNTSPGEYFLTRHLLKDLFHRPLCAFVAITDRIFAEVPVNIYQTIVCSPAGDADAGDPPSQLACILVRFSQSRLDLCEDLWSVPSQMSVAVDGGILESMDFFQQQFRW